MGITKILLQYDVCVGEDRYDVLIPMPANTDVCMNEIGIDDFDDADDQWDRDFRDILGSLIGENSCHVMSVDPETGREESLAEVNLANIQGYLAYNDCSHFVIVSGKKTIRFTRGHAILWLAGFDRNEIMPLGFKVEVISNKRMKDLF